MKPWWKSRTVWAQVVTIIVAILSALIGQDIIRENPELVSLLLLAVAVQNAVLRWLTKEAISSVHPVFDKWR